MNKETDNKISINKLAVGDVVKFPAKGTFDGIQEETTYTAMIHDQRYGPDGKLIGLEVLILAKPGTFHGQLSGKSEIIENPSMLGFMGLNAERHRIHFNPVLIPASAFPDKYSDVFKQNAFEKDPCAEKIGELSGKFLGGIMRFAKQLYIQGNRRTLSLAELEKTDFLTTKPPAPAEEFTKAVLDMKIEDAARPEIGLIWDFLAERLPNPGMIKDGFNVEPITTIRQLERILETDPEQLKAFYGVGPKTYNEVLEAAHEALEDFNAALEAGVFEQEPHAEFVFEASEPKIA